MGSDGVELTDDLNQCEGAIWGWIQRQGAAALERHLAQKNSVTKERGDPPPRRVKNYLLFRYAPSCSMAGGCCLA